MPILIVNSVHRIYDGGGRAVAALRGVSFEAETGDFIALMGPSGCGKSTLLHIVGAMDRPTHGRVSLGGVALDSLTEEALARLRRKKIGFVFQFFNLLPTLTVAENVALPLNSTEHGNRRRTSALLRRWAGLDLQTARLIFRPSSPEARCNAPPWLAPSSLSLMR